MRLPRRSVLLRVAPFVLFMALLALLGAAPSDGSWGVDPHWLYAAAVIAVGALLAFFWREYGELARQNLPDASEVLLAVVVGLGVFVLWIQLDAQWMTLARPTAAFEPLTTTGSVDWSLVALRWSGATFLVPVMEELFWRSFLMRWVAHPVFEGVDPRRVGLKAIVLSTFVFTLAHTLWLAAIVAGLAYAWLYRNTGKLWVPIIAHAVTNGALGVWVVLTGNWAYW